MGKFGKDAVATVSESKANGELDLTKPLFVMKSKNTKITFVPLTHFTPETSLGDSDRLVAHSVAGLDRKVVCAKALKKYKDKNGIEKYGYDADSWTQCEECDVANASKNEKNMATESVKSIFAFMVGLLLSHEQLQTVLDVDGNPVKIDGKYKEELKTQEFSIDDEKIVILEMPIGDAYFDSATSGVAKSFDKLDIVSKKTKKAPIETKVLTWTYGDIDANIYDEDPMDAVMMDKITELRNKDYSELIDSVMPIPYADYFEQKHDRPYVSPQIARDKAYKAKGEQMKAEGRKSEDKKSEDKSNKKADAKVAVGAGSELNDDTPPF